MKCAIDTNLLISATFNHTTPPAQVLAAWRMGHIEWVTCSEQMTEVGLALFRPKILTRSVGGLPLAQSLVGQMQQLCSLKTLLKPLPAICRDPRDDYLFALHDQGHIDMIVSGDKDVLALKPRYPVLTPRELIDRL
jgi:putative PIN family toxin of toxin-antitoxin system